MHPVFNPVSPYRYLLPNMYLSVSDIANPDLLACSSQTWISIVITRFYEEYCQHGRLAPKTVIGPPLLGREGFTQFAQGLPDRCDSSTACKLCRLEHLGNSYGVSQLRMPLSEPLIESGILLPLVSVDIGYQDGCCLLKSSRIRCHVLSEDVLIKIDTHW